MRRFLRRTFAAAAAASLLALVVCAAAWEVSFRTETGVRCRFTTPHDATRPGPGSDHPIRYTWEYAVRWSRGEAHLSRLPYRTGSEAEDATPGLHFIRRPAPDDDASPRNLYQGGDFSYGGVTRSRWFGVTFVAGKLAVCDDPWVTVPCDAVVVPTRVAGLLLSLLPAVWLVWFFAGRGRRRHRARAGRCAACGYDLRATSEGGGAQLARCPECGAAVNASANASAPAGATAD